MNLCTLGDRLIPVWSSFDGVGVEVERRNQKNRVVHYDSKSPMKGNNVGPPKKKNNINTGLKRKKTIILGVIEAKVVI